MGEWDNSNFPAFVFILKIIKKIKISERRIKVGDNYHSGWLFFDLVLNARMLRPDTKFHFRGKDC